MIKSLEDNVDDIQGKIRRKTLIFNGFPKSVEGSGGWPACKDFISSFISEHFNMAENVIIERAHCMPRQLSKSKQEISTAYSCCFLTVGAGERDSHVSTKSFKRKALRPQRRRVEAICQPNVQPKSNTTSQAGSQYTGS